MNALGYAIKNLNPINVAVVRANIK